MSFLEQVDFLDRRLCCRTDSMKYEIVEKDGKRGVVYYNYFFPVTSKDDIVKTLYGSETYLYKCIGYCCHKHVYVTENIAKRKKCIAKHCDRFIRCPYSEEFWRKREEKRAAKKQRRNDEKSR